MFKLPEEVKKGIKDFQGSLDDLLSGRISSARFTGIRVPWGIYSHRGGQIFMSRLRIPAGQVGSTQLRAIAQAARLFGNGKAHLTTRQDIQLHEIRLADTIKVIEYLKDYDLSPRGGGGNTVRSITSCALSGVCSDEVFAVNPYVIALTQYLLRQEESFNLPRKLKISFSGCGQDCAGCLVNDVGLLAVVRDGGKGFRVFVGGGLGAEPILGQVLEDFIAEEDLGYSVLAIKNVFYKKGDRRNKHHNRLRFLIKDHGFDNFKKWYLEEFQDLKNKEYINLRKIENREIVSTGGEIPALNDEEFKEFIKYNLTSQKQSGLTAVELRIPRGDISADQLEKLASLEKEFPDIEFRTSQNQNIFVINVKKIQAHELFLKLKEISPDFLYPSTLLDVVCCKGALTCNLGLCNSPALTEQIEKTIKNDFIGTKAFKKLNIKINGCQNCCGQHPLGLVAWHGVVRRVDGRPVPFYKLLLGGRKAAQETRLAQDTGILIPAKNVSLFVRDFVARLNTSLTENTDIFQFIVEKGESLAKEIAAKYAYVPSYQENKDFYIDWGKTEEFSLAGLGPGECGAGVMDMVQADLTEAQNYLTTATKNNYASADIKKALFFASRALLVVKGSEPKEEMEALREFIEKFVKDNIANPEFAGLAEVYQSVKEDLEPTQKEAKFLYAKEFLEHVKGLYKNMDSAFNFPKFVSTAINPRDFAIKESKWSFVLDLKGTPCPINYVKAKLYLENLKIGDIVSIYLDEGEPINNVPKSLKNDGQEIIKIEKKDNFYEVIVKKLVDN